MSTNVQPKALPSVLIVGAGITGAALAHRLAEQGCRVTLVDASVPAAEASGRSFGWINANNYLTPEHFHLRVAAFDAYRDLERDVGPIGVSWPGAIIWEEAGAALERTVAALTALGYPLHRLTRDDVRRLEPLLADPPEEALHFPGEGVVDLANLTRKLLDAAAGHGAQFSFGTPVTGIHLTGGRATGVMTAQGLLRADRVIVAAGIGSPAILAGTGLALPMLRRPGLLLRTRPMPPLVRHILASPEQELRQDPTGRLLAPTSPGHQSDDTTEVGETALALADATLERVRAMLPRADLAWEDVRLAYRPVPGDGLPVIGPTAIDNLYLAVMHSGATLAPLIGRLLAQEVVSGDSTDMLAPFRPGRFHRA